MGRWVYGLDHNGDRGEVKGLKKTDSLSLTIASYGRGLCQSTCVFSAFGYGAVKESGGQNRTLSLSVRLSHPYGRKETEATQGERMQTGR